MRFVLLIPDRFDRQLNLRIRAIRVIRGLKFFLELRCPPLDDLDECRPLLLEILGIGKCH